MRIPRRPSRLVLWIMEQITETPYRALFGVWAGIVVCFAVIYFALSYVGAEHSLTGLYGLDPLLRLGNSVYFSLITSTTVGYGDLVPKGIAKFFAATEAVFAYFVFAVFIAKLLSYKSDLAIREVHALMFESKFHRTREGLFTVRKDFDGLIIRAEQDRRLPEEEWERVSIAAWEGERLLESILAFYSEQRDFVTLDIKRERLLLEAVHRTFLRLQHLLDTLDAAGIRWRPMPIATDLRDFLQTAAAILPHWLKSGHRENAGWFEKVQIALKECRSRVGASARRSGKRKRRN